MQSCKPAQKIWIKYPDIRIWCENSAKKPDLPKWNGYANTKHRHCM